MVVHQQKLVTGLNAALFFFYNIAIISYKAAVGYKFIYCRKIHLVWYFLIRKIFINLLLGFVCYRINILFTKFCFYLFLACQIIVKNIFNQRRIGTIFTFT